MKKYKYRKSFTFDKKRYWVSADTLQELGKKEANKIHELTAQKKKASGITVTDWTMKCIDIYKTNQSDITRKKYISRINHCILEYIGDKRMKDITPLDCQEIMNYQIGRSKTQINEVYQSLKFIFSHAVFNEIVQKDPTLTLIKPKGKHTPRRALTDEEREIFLKIAVTDRKYYCFLLMYYCGCRPMEACECKGSDMFLYDEHPMLHIRGTKTANADRNVPIPPELWELIKNTPKDEFIAVTERGTPITLNNRKRTWDSLWRRMNIEAGTKLYRNSLQKPFLISRDLSPYCLRHDFCTNLAKKGIDIRIAQKLMGHSDIKLTANIYTHVDVQHVIEAMKNK